ncbi:hypothetical protein QBC42DRAFT_286212 [Cladorrhinum samala]|uniref:Uncharacterized protein n=1 Tax=Cladorrhinum samala TaxID=585594 RepID=A0AAV9HQX3_9PEZI|nr:hypothetical protein QBC42DRAFT_286212 [Cladorrhinum samala]
MIPTRLMLGHEADSSSYLLSSSSPPKTLIKPRMQWLLFHVPFSSKKIIIQPDVLKANFTIIVVTMFSCVVRVQMPKRADMSMAF